MSTKLKTWEDIENFDDIILPGERNILSELKKEAEANCPHLQREGEFFYYCGLNIPEITDRKPAPFNPIYQRHIGLAELQLHCMASFETCCYYSGKLKRHNS